MKFNQAKIDFPIKAKRTSNARWKSSDYKYYFKTFTNMRTCQNISANKANCNKTSLIHHQKYDKTHNSHFYIAHLCIFHNILNKSPAREYKFFNCNCGWNIIISNGSINGRVSLMYMCKEKLGVKKGTDIVVAHDDGL